MCLSCVTKFVRSALNSDTIDTRPFRFVVNSAQGRLYFSHDRDTDWAFVCVPTSKVNELRPHGRASSVPSDHAHFFLTEPSIFDGHANERAFVLLIVTSKRVLMKSRSVSSAHVFAKLMKVLSGGRDQARLSLHPFVIDHAIENSRF